MTVYFNIEVFRIFRLLNYNRCINISDYAESKETRRHILVVSFVHCFSLCKIYAHDISDAIIVFIAPKLFHYIIVITITVSRYSTRCNNSEFLRIRATIVFYAFSSILRI